MKLEAIIFKFIKFHNEYDRIEVRKWNRSDMIYKWEHLEASKLRI
jgi:hypothetical protein